MFALMLSLLLILVSLTVLDSYQLILFKDKCSGVMKVLYSKLAKSAGTSLRGVSACRLAKRNNKEESKLFILTAAFKRGTGVRNLAYQH